MRKLFKKTVSGLCGAMLICQMVTCAWADETGAQSNNINNQNAAKAVEEATSETMKEAAEAIRKELNFSTAHIAFQLFSMANESIANDDYEEARILFENAARLGSSQAKYILAMCYFYGTEKMQIEQDAKYGCDLMADAILSDGSVDSIMDGAEDKDALMADIYPFGFWAYSNYEKESALTIMSYAAEGGNVPAMDLMGQMLYQENEIADSTAYYKMAAEKGYAPSKYQYAVALEQGYGIPKDEEKAKELFEESAEEIQRQAQNTEDPKVALVMGFCCQYGDGSVKKSREDAKKWFARAYELGDPEGAYRIGAMMVNHELVASEQETFQWTKAGANAWHPDAMLAYAALTLFGVGTDADEELGRTLMEIAAERGSETAQRYLATGILSNN